MTLVSPSQSNPGEEITAAKINDPVNAIADVVNGGLDSDNISSLSGTKIQSGTLPAAAAATNANVETRFLDTNVSFIASGCTWSGDSYGSTLAASMTAGVAYIGGKRLVISSVASRAFTASKDTYVDLDTTGAPAYTEVANNAASPALSAGYIRIAIVITGASSIAAAGSVNQGQVGALLPIVSSQPYEVTDSLGNLICNRDPQMRLLGYRQITADVTSTTVTTAVDVTGLSVPFIVPTGRKVKATAYQNASNGNGGYVVYIRESSTTLTRYDIPGATLSPSALECVTSPSAGAHTYKVSHSQGSAGTMTLRAQPTYPAFLKIELM